jgi:hypothetical protein
LHELNWFYAPKEHSSANFKFEEVFIHETSYSVPKLRPISIEREEDGSLHRHFRAKQVKKT